MVNIDDSRKQMTKLEKKSRRPQSEKLQPVFDYLDERLNEYLSDRCEEPGQVVALLVYDRGRMSVNCYLRQVDESDIHRELNRATQYQIRYPRGNSEIPNINSYQHGIFVPAIQINRDQASAFSDRRKERFPKNSYVVLGRSVPVENIDDLTVINY